MPNRQSGAANKKAAARAAALGSRDLLDRSDPRRLHALGAARRDELDLLAFRQRLEAAAALDFLEVREQVFAAVGRRDEAKALRIVEPLDRTGLFLTH